jgi:hypothetical protein
LPKFEDAVVFLVTALGLEEEDLVFLNLDEENLGLEASFCSLGFRFL